MSNTREAELVRQLVLLLRKNGERILSGQGKLSLTTTCLLLLNEGFHSISDGDFNSSFEVVPGNSPRLPLVHEMQFLYDFIQKSLALKIIHGNSNLQTHIHLEPFRSLKTLEIKRTPLHMIEGLQKMRNKLNVIICTRCLQNITEVFEICGGDLSSPMSWTHLHTANLAYNNITALDGSLRLLPMLEVFDVSHNAIKSTDNYLEHLTELRVLNLGFNGLRRIPSLSISSKTKLRTLVLRNNFLESLQGLEELAGLRELDIAHNCLSDHRDLEPLRALQWLQILVVDGNPICFHKRHRILTIQCLHPTAFKRMMLDGKMITEREYQYGKKNFDSQASFGSRPYPLGGTSQTTDTATGYSSMEHSGEFTTTLDEDMGQISSGSEVIPIGRRRIKKGKSSRKVREADISDQTSTAGPSSDGGSLSQTPVLSPILGGEHIIIKEEIETMRDHLGPDWLQKLTLQRQKTIQNTAHVSKAPIPSNVTEDDLYLGGNSSLANETVPKSSDEKASVIRVIRDRDEELLPTKGSPLTQSTVVDNHGGSNEQYSDSVVSENPQGSPEKTQDEPDCTNDILNNVELSEAGVGIASVADIVVKADNKLHVADKAKIQKENSQIIWQRSDSETPVDYGPETEPYILSLYDDPATQLLVSVTERYILEKDINGDLSEALDIKCLLSGSILQEAFEDLQGGGDEKQVIELNFDYLKKDRRQRRYIMEKQDSEELMELLRPVLEAKDCFAKIKDRLQCLKCGAEFEKSEAVVKLKNIQKEKREQEESTKFNNSLGEIFSCPSCTSELVIELDVEELAKARGSNYTTPVGSYVSGHLSFTPQAASSTYTTPLKTEPIYAESSKPVAVKNSDNSSVHSDSTETSFQSCPTPYLSLRSSASDLTLSTQPTASSLLKALQDSAAKQANLNQNSNDKSRKAQPNLPRSVSGTMLSTLNENPGRSDRSVQNHFQKNRSTQDLQKLPSVPRARKRLGSADSDIIVLDRQESKKSTTSGCSDITVLSGSDITICTNPSARPSVTDSDILILDNPRSQMSTSEGGEDSSPTSNDITILPAREVYNSSSEHSSTMGTPVASMAEAEQVMRTGNKADMNGIKIKLHSPLSPNTPSSEVSPCGSLPTSAVSSMVSSVYEKTIQDKDKNGVNNVQSIYGSAGEDSIEQMKSLRQNDSSLSFQSAVSGSGDISNVPCCHSSGETSGRFFETNIRTVDSSGVQVPPSPRDLSPVAVEGGASYIKYSYDDFKLVDHRLKLYMDMQLFESETEEFSIVLKSAVLQFIKNEEFQGLLIASSTHLYIMRIIASASDTDFEKSLKLVLRQPLADIRYVDIGLGHQSFHIESASEASSFTFLLRDEARCKRFIKSFTAVIQATTFTTGSKLEAISKSTPSTLENLQHQVLEDIIQDEDIDRKVSLYVLGFLRTGSMDAKGSSSRTPVSIILTSSHICLAMEDHRWPLPRMINTSHAINKNTQFQLKDCQKITNVISVDICSQVPEELNINFHDEESNEECVWLLVMETATSGQTLLTSVCHLWEEQFGVELQINQS